MRDRNGEPRVRGINAPTGDRKFVFGREIFVAGLLNLSMLFKDGIAANGDGKLSTEGRRRFGMRRMGSFGGSGGGGVGGA
jgi:hypothetical protein